MALAFHQSTFDLLDIAPRVSPERIEAIDEREQHCHRSFPASIREWFAVEGVESLFYEHTNQDELVSHEELGETSEVLQGYLRVATENQAVVAWYAELDGSNDPPVLHNNDEWDDDLSAINWEPNSSTFSGNRNGATQNSAVKVDGPLFGMADQEEFFHCGRLDNTAGVRFIARRCNNTTWHSGHKSSSGNSSKLLCSG